MGGGAMDMIDAWTLSVDRQMAEALPAGQIGNLPIRERIRRLAAPVQFVFLDGSAELIAQRMALRSGHYMHPELLASQFNALERPEADEDDVIRLDITRPVGQLLTEALVALQAARATARI